MEKVAGSPLFPLNPRKLSQKLKFWESLVSFRKYSDPPCPFFSFKPLFKITISHIHYFIYHGQNSITRSSIWENGGWKYPGG
jgi:hypothetical protein